MATPYYQDNIHLKPMPLSSATSLHSGFSSNSYNPLSSTGSRPDPSFQQAEQEDQHLKTSIRILKLISRILATILSATTLAPLLQTLIKFLRTRNVYFTVEGQQRTAWAHDTIAWYTYMYAAVSAVSLLLNLIVLIAYLRSGYRGGNRAAVYSSAWTWTILAANVIIWAISAGIYRYGKEPVDGKFRDLWGWTCSRTAKELQDVLTSVDFDKYCGVQTASFYSGVANVAAGVLSLVIIVLSVMRRKTKQRVSTFSAQRSGDVEPLCSRASQPG